MKTEYLFCPSEFSEPPVSVQHITLTVDIAETEVTVSSETSFRAAVPISEVKLNAKNLEIKSLTQNGRRVEYTYADDIITLQLNKPLAAGAEFRIAAKTICRPTDNILEGLYYDITPKGLPRTIISQCQQWGFQRIAPCIDDMRAKCTWTTTIIADSRFSNLISNGNVSRARTRYDNTRDTITYQNDEPMPPYLFFLGVGTWDTFTRDFCYPDGKHVRLELLTLPGSDAYDAGVALDIMADAILWTHIFTGPERFDDEDKRMKLYELCTRRFKGEDGLTEEIENLSGNMVFGYQYPYEVYREIAMQNSDFGGMENTGNTTIIASRIMPDAEITDASYEYMLGVKQHEFYHNLNGSSVTGDTPFSIWLNEAVTVMMEDEYLAFHFGKDYIRLNNILQLYMPGTGTFSLDTGAVSMPIEPEGFNDPNDLITAVTYVKAPEFTRMIETMLGKPAFSWALDLYHKRFAGSNASPRDWLHAMEDVGKSDFSFMADRWLKQTGYPTVFASAVYNADNDTAEITVTQKGFGTQNPWIFPFKGKLMNSEGEEVAQFTKKIDAERLTFSVPCSGPFDFAVWNENHSAYIKMERTEADEVLYLQLLLDKDPVTRFLAFSAVFEREMIRLLENENAVPSTEFADTVIRTLKDEELMKSCGSMPLLMFESVSDSRFAHEYGKLYSAKQRILRGIAEKYEDTLRALYVKYDVSYQADGFEPAVLSAQFKANAVKNLILTILASLDTQDVHYLIRTQYRNANSATNRLSALSLYLSSSASDRMDILLEELARSAEHPLAFENFIAASANTAHDTVSYLKVIEASPKFHIEQAGEARSLYLRFAQNRKVSLETEDGREFLKASIIRLSKVNAYITTGMLSVFSHMKEYPDELKEKLMAVLLEIESSVSPDESPAVYQTAKQILSAVR
ncbi:MAG: M1 family metallopeptidase [Methanocorpusculum sp.]|nr:M1 family metallopeptidase [Methanocorpusculum sp.]